MTIKAGDVVMVARMPHKCGEYTLGHIFTVTAVFPMQWMRCPKCGVESIVRDDAAEGYDAIKGGGFPVSWLRKIDPLREPEAIPRPEEITA
jgi:hypothetical protein